MSDIDRILAELEQMIEAERRERESALFSTRTFSDQPLIERGRDLQARQERIRQRDRSRNLQERIRQRDAERAERRQQAAEQRQAARSHRPSQQQTTLWPSEFDRTFRADTEPARQPAPRPQPQSTPAPASWPLSTPPTAERDTTPLWRRPLPEPLRKMRQLEADVSYLPSFTYRTNASAKLFFEQARLLEAYEDDYSFDGNYFQYFPTYQSMNNDQLRGYFSWRTRVRTGNIERAPLSFAFVYVYELLCGIGTTPGEQGYEDLRSFGAAFCEAAPYDGERLMRYLRDWLHDYAVYHNIPEKLSSAFERDTDESLLTLLSAEHTLLRAAGLDPKSLNTTVSEAMPTNEELLHAISGASTYRLDQSRLAKDEPELLAQVMADIFEALVLHCAKRRKTDFIEGMFGFSYATPHTMFASAVFYEPTPHPDCSVTVSPVESYLCTNGRWYHQLALEVTQRNSELGRYLHDIDYELREQLDYAYPLKPRSVPKYVERMVKKAVTARIKERVEAEEARRRAEEEAEKRRITIDRSKLRGIRAAAAQTREALLTDEERGLEPVVVVPAANPLSSPTAGAMGVPPNAPAGALGGTPIAPASVCEAVATYGLTEPELRVLEGLLAHTPASELLGPGDPFVSVVVDTINEKLFDLVGDMVVEFDGDEPSVIEDYLDDIREVL